jgi:hypothetical protein
MTPTDVLKYYGSQYRFAKSTGMASASLCNWLKWGYIPEASQYKIERLTKGELKTEWSLDNG